MIEKGHREVSEDLRRRYARLLAENGDGPGAVEQADVETQERRMFMLCEAGDLKTAKLLDFGCGTGHLLTVLQANLGFEGVYVGYDITLELLEVARKKHPSARFEVRDVLQEGIEEEFDFVLINGVFNNAVGDNWKWMTAVLKTLFVKTRVALAFNSLSRYVDYVDNHLYYVDPAKVFQFCKEELSPRVTLRHDYCTREGVVPYEFTTYVHATDIACRKLKLD